MSLLPSTKKFNTQLIDLKEKGVLLIPSSIISKIHHLHHHIKTDEWSSILVYEVLEGSVSDPATLKLRVKDFILMDIGNATYTEYDYSPADKYSFNKFTNALENENKLGHLHSHHNMACFFSGTDTAELHENAPNHNFYLSLIVNFKNIDQWCAAVAVCAEEIVEENIIRKGSIKTIRKWRGDEGQQVSETTVEIDEDEPKNVTRSILYKIDMILVEDPEGEVLSLDDRIAELRKNKRPVYPTYSSTYNQSKSTGNFNEWETDKFESKADELNNKKTHSSPSSGGAGKHSSFQEKGQEKGKKGKDEEKTLEEINQQYELALQNEGKDDFVKSLGGSNLGYERARDCFSPGKVRSVLIKLLGGDPTNMDLKTTLDSYFLDLTKGNQNMILGRLEEQLPLRLDSAMSASGEDLDYHCICYSFVDLLSAYKNQYNYKTGVKLLLDVFDIFIDFKHHTNEMTAFLTGLPVESDHEEEHQFMSNYP